MSQQGPVPQRYPSRRERREQQAQAANPANLPPHLPQNQPPVAPPRTAPSLPVPPQPKTPPVSVPPAPHVVSPTPQIPQSYGPGPRKADVPVSSGAAAALSRPPAGSPRPGNPTGRTIESKNGKGPTRAGRGRETQENPPVSTEETAPAAASPKVEPKKGEAKRRRTPTSVLVMSGIGQTMLTVGVILGLFVVWQLYITTWQVQGATASAVESFQNSTANDATETTEVQRTDPPPGVTIPAVGQTFGTLHVPRWDSMVIPIMQGTNESVLDTGYAGHYVDTQGPGELGNFALAAHRRSYGNSFRRVHELQTGDPLVVETAQAWLVYQVTSTEIVLPQQGEVIHPVPHEPKGTVPHERLMTLTTCHPEYGNTQRFIVYSKLSYWVPRTQGRPLALKGLAQMQKVGQGTAPEGPQDVANVGAAGAADVPGAGAGTGAGAGQADGAGLAG